MSFARKTVLVTGAAHGIGAAIAQRFAHQQSNLLLLDRDTEALKGMVHALRKEGAQIKAIACDLCDAGCGEILTKELTDKIIHVLINNAGINPNPTSLHLTDEEDWNSIMDINLKAIYRVCQKTVLHMPNGASIINIASILGLRGVKNSAAYSASKGGVIALTRAMAMDYAPRIRVNCVCPGAIDTDMFAVHLNRTAHPEEERQRIMEAMPMQRLGKPEDIAGAVLFLASEEAGWITGTTLTVDGGDSI